MNRINLKNIKIQNDKSINEVFKKMDEEKTKFLVLIDKKDDVTGFITDGDLRRLIWSGINLSNTISKYAKKSFVYVNENKKINKNKIKKNIEYIPVLQKKKLIDIISKNDLLRLNKHFLNNENKKKIDYKILVMAGGEGKRMGEISKIIPKPLMPIKKNKTIIQEIINKIFKDISTKEIYISLKYKKNLIISFLKQNYKKKINFILEEKSLGTIGSASLIDLDGCKNLIVTNCDTIIDANIKDIMTFHVTNKNDITIVGCLISNQINYGVCKVTPNGKLIKIVEKPKTNHLCSTGFYIFKSEIIKKIKRNNHMDVDVLVNSCLKNKKKISIYPVHRKSWKDLGTIALYKKYLI